MNRRDLLKTLGAATVGGGLRPNFLFIIADDANFRTIHGLNNPEIQTPNLDRLAGRGCSFTQCFHQGSWTPAVCIASRSMLNSGLTVFRAQRRIEHSPLWVETFGGSGYDTSIVGKWHLSDASLARSFKEKGPVSPGMFESGPSAYNRPSQGNTWTPWDTSLKGQWLNAGEWQKAGRDEIKHSAQIWSECASDYLLKHATGAKPFFLYVGFNSPHDPRQSPKEFVDRYPRERMEVPPNFLPEHPFNQGDNRIRDEVLAPFPRTREAVQMHRSEYYAHMTYMDFQIGRMLDALEKSGQANNTYVIFTSDHGLAVGEHGLMGKQNMYDHSIRMPLLISGPGIAAGKRIHEMVYQHSMFATTCELVGVQAPKSLEFPSLVDLMKGSGREKHDAIFSYYRGFQRAVRTREHKLIVYPEAGITQLFDLKKDPWEIRNLTDDPKYAALKGTLLGRLHRFQRDLEDDLPPVAVETK